MKNKKLISGIALIVLIAIVAIGYHQSRRNANPKTIDQLEELNLGAESGLLNSAIWVAQHKGYFFDEGLNVNIKEFQAGRLALLAMFNNEALDVVTVAPTPIMLNSFDRQDFRILATFVESQADEAIISNKDNGITTVADLKGKKIGLPKGTSAHFFLELVLVENGILPSQVHVIDIKPYDLPDALASRRVDAVAIWQPHAYRVADLLKSKALELGRPGIHRSTFNFVAMNEVAQKRQSAIAKLLRAVDKANVFISQNGAEAQAIVAAKLKLEKEIVARLLPKYNYRLFLDQLLLLDLEGQARWAMKTKLTDKTTPPNYLRLISASPLKQIKPDAVNIIESDL